MLKKKIAVVLVAAALVASMMQSADASFTTGNTRKWHATYNGITLHGVQDAAVPSKWLAPGKRARVCYPRTGRCITIVAHSGGCRCFDLSREGFMALGGSKAISDGVIVVTATKL